MIKVIIVEDDPMVVAINQDYLQRVQGFSLEGTCNNADECLEYLEKNNVDLILLDVYMQGITGLELLSVLHKKYPKVDVIMITAARSSAEIQKALHLGVIDYLMKPFQFERFQAALIAYQERFRLLHSAKELDQDVLDQRIFIHKKAETPKGISEETLQHIKENFVQTGKACSLKDLEEVTGLSRVSLKKYLTYLEQSGEIFSRLEYPDIGRPIRLYSWK